MEEEERRAAALCEWEQNNYWHKILTEASYGKVDSDLLDRLLNGQKYLSTTSYLAAEWAARQCGVPADRPEGTYPPTYIIQLVTKLRHGK